MTNEQKIRVLVAKPGLDGHDRGAKVIARALRDATRRLRTGARHASADTADWLRDEARLVIPRGELDDFLDDVDRLRERAERLQVRVNRLRGQGA